MPSTVIVPIKYVVGEVIERQVTFVTGAARSYTRDGQQCMLRRYETSDIGGVIRDVCILVNLETENERGNIAIREVLKAIAEMDVTHYYFGNYRGMKFPLKPQMFESPIDGSVRPMGLAACVRYVEASRYATTELVIPPYYDFEQDS